MTFNNKLRYTLRKIRVYKKGDVLSYVYIPRVTDRHKVSFDDVVARAAEACTYSEHELRSVFNYALKIARTILSEGNDVEFGDLGILRLALRSISVDKAEDFSVRKHIKGCEIALDLSSKFSNLNDIHLQRLDADVPYLKKNKAAKAG